MHVEIQVALNFLISFLYNKLPRRRVNQFGEELENALKHKFEGHWYPEKPFKGSAFRCLKTTPPLDPVFDVAAVESGMDLIDIQENLPQELSIWIDPGEVSYRMSEKGPVKILYSESDRPHDLENPDREVIRTFNPEAQCFKPIEATAMAFGSLSLAPSSASPPSLHVIPNGFPSSPAGVSTATPIAAPNNNNSTSVPAATVVTVPINSNGTNGTANLPTNNGNNLITPGNPSVAPSPIYKSFNTGSMGHSAFLPKATSANVTFTTATFAQTKFGSTKLKSNTKRSHRMSPTEFSNYIKQRALQQQAASAVSPNGGVPDRVSNGERVSLSNGLVNGVHSPPSLNYVHGSPNGTGLSSGNISPQNSRSMSPIGGVNSHPGSLDSVSNLLFLGDHHSTSTTATSPITHSSSPSLSSYYSGNHGTNNLVGGSSASHGSISPRHHPSHHSSGLNGLYGSSSSSSSQSIESQLADLLGTPNLLPKASPVNNGTSSSSSVPNNNNVFNRFASLFDKNSALGSTSPNGYPANSSPPGGSNNIITLVANNSSNASNLMNVINNNNNTNNLLHAMLNDESSSSGFPSNTILGSSGLHSLYNGHQSPSNELQSGHGSSNGLSSSTFSIVDSISSSSSASSSTTTSPPALSSSITLACSSPAVTSPIAVPSSSSNGSSSPSSSDSGSLSSSTSSSPSSSSVPQQTSLPNPVLASGSNSSVSSSTSTSAPPSNKGYDSFSFSLNGVSYPNQYQHLLVTN